MNAIAMMSSTLSSLTEVKAFLSNLEEEDLRIELLQAPGESAPKAIKFDCLSAKVQMRWRFIFQQSSGDLVEKLARYGLRYAYVSYGSQSKLFTLPKIVERRQNIALRQALTPLFNGFGCRVPFEVVDDLLQELPHSTRLAQIVNQTQWSQDPQTGDLLLQPETSIEQARISRQQFRLLHQLGHHSPLRTVICALSEHRAVSVAIEQVDTFLTLQDAEPWLNQLLKNYQWHQNTQGLQLTPLVATKPNFDLETVIQKLLKNEMVVIEGQKIEAFIEALPKSQPFQPCYRQAVSPVCGREKPNCQSAFSCTQGCEWVISQKGNLLLLPQRITKLPNFAQLIHDLQNSGKGAVAEKLRQLIEPSMA